MRVGEGSSTRDYDQPMPKYLQLTSNQAERWQLPDDCDLEEVRLDVSNAMRSASVESVTVIEPDSKGQTTLVVNGKVVTVCAVYETPSHRAASF